MKRVRLSPSKLAVLELCSHYKSTPYSSDAAAEGTMLHERLELNNFSGLSDMHLSLVTMCKDYVDRLLQTRLPRRFNEVRLRISGFSGTADVVILSDGSRKADLVDYKFGQGEIEDAEDNFQGQAYALGVFKKWSRVREVTVHFLMPKQDEVSTHTFSRADVPVIEQRIRALKALCSRPKAERPYTPHQKACAFCDNKARCPGLAGIASEVALKSGGLPVPYNCVPLTMADPEDRAKAQAIAGIMEDWAKQVKQNNLRAVLEEGIEIPGFKVYSRRGNRSMTDVPSGVELAMNNYGIGLEELMPLCSMSYSKFEGVVEDSIKRREGGISKEELADKMSLFRAQLEDRMIVVEAPMITYLRKTSKKG